jgi:hypothetical protein
MSSRLRLEMIAPENVGAACRLRVRPEQEGRVAPVPWSLTEAYAHGGRTATDREHRSEPSLTPTTGKAGGQSVEQARAWFDSGWNAGTREWTP